MSRPAGWMKALTGRSAMTSPGAPSLRRDVERAFWREIATGLTSGEAAIAVGASQAAGSRWLRERGGIPSLGLAPLSGRHLSFHEREEIALRRAQGAGIREIARRCGATRRPSRGSCLAMLRPGVGSWSIGHRSRSGRRRCWRSGRRRPSWSSTTGCGSTCRSGWPARSALSTASRWPGQKPVPGWAEQWAAEGSAVGVVVESGADREPVADRLPRR